MNPVTRVAHRYPEELRIATSGCIITIDRGVSIQSISRDPQVYDVSYIQDKSPKSSLRAAYDYVRQHLPELRRMQRSEAVKQIDDAIEQLRLKPLRWGYYSMPD